LRTQRDEVEGITWYYDVTTPKYDTTNNLHLYIGEREEHRWLRFRIRYTGDDWVFVERYIFNVDGVKYTLDAGYTEVNRDVASGGRVYEWYDKDPDSTDIDLIRAIVGSTKTILRYEGDTYHYDRIIGSSEKSALRHVLDAYEYMKTK